MAGSWPPGPPPALRSAIASGPAVTLLQDHRRGAETGRDESGRTVPTCTRDPSAGLPCPVARRGHRAGLNKTSIRVPAGVASPRARGYAPHGAATRRAAVELVGGPSFRGHGPSTGGDRARSASGEGGRSRVVTILVTAVITFLVGILVLVGSAVGISAAAIAVLSQGLPDPTNLAGLTFSQPTVVYDRTGTVQLGRFQQEQRRVVTFAEVPQLVIDATTTAEDRTFWTNQGFDPARSWPPRPTTPRPAPTAAPPRSPSSSSGLVCFRRTSSPPGRTATSARPRS